MKSVLNNENTIIIKNSRFICLTYQISLKNEIEKILNEVKVKYPDATHYCYAYVLDSEKHESDDGEPSGTAGMPILQVLEKNGLNHVLCIVVRYFGKIKLGAGGLVRAYTKSTVECIKDKIIFLKKGYEVKISFNYDDLKKIDYLLKDVPILNKEFNNKIVYDLYVDLDLYEILKNFNYIEIEVLRELYF